VSAKDRAFAKSVSVEDGELDRLFRSVGMSVPSWIKKGVKQDRELGVRLYGALEHLAGIEFLLSTTTPHKDDIRKMLEAKDLLERFVQGCYALDELPKQAPKHREALSGLYDQAFDVIEPIRKTYANYGDTPQNLGL
jgi:hypothetical protein